MRWKYVFPEGAAPADFFGTVIKKVAVVQRRAQSLDAQSLVPMAAAAVSGKVIGATLDRTRQVNLLVVRHAALFLKPIDQDNAGRDQDGNNAQDDSGLDTGHIIASPPLEVYLM